MSFAPKGLVKTLAEEGKSSKEIAERMQRSTATAKRMLKRIGAQRPVGRPSRVSAEFYEFILDKVNHGIYNWDVWAADAGVCKRTLQRKIAKLRKQ